MSGIFYKELQNTVNKINNRHKIVIFRIENEEIIGVKRKFREPVINETENC